MAFSTGTQTVTMTAVVPDTMASDLGLTGAQNQVGQVLQLPYRDALALVQGGYASFGSTAETQDDTDAEGGRYDLILPAAGGPVAADTTVNGASVEARGADHARLIAGADVAITVAIEQSIDGQTWMRPVAGTAVAAGSSALLEQAIAGGYVRGVVITGATAATAARAQLTLSS